MLRISRSRRPANLNASHLNAEDLRAGSAMNSREAIRRPFTISGSTNVAVGSPVEDSQTYRGVVVSRRKGDTATHGNTAHPSRAAATCHDRDDRPDCRLRDATYANRIDPSTMRTAVTVVNQLNGCRMIAQTTAMAGPIYVFANSLRRGNIADSLEGVPDIAP